MAVNMDCGKQRLQMKNKEFSVQNFGIDLSRVPLHSIWMQMGKIWCVVLGRAKRNMYHVVSDVNEAELLRGFG